MVITIHAWQRWRPDADAGFQARDNTRAPGLKIQMLGDLTEQSASLMFLRATSVILEEEARK